MVTIIAVALTALITGGFVLAGVYLGLKWQVQIQQGEKPTVELPKVPNPITAMQERKAEKEAVNILDEYINGPREVR